VNLNLFQANQGAARQPAQLK